MKEKLKEKKYLLGYVLQIFGLVLFKAYLTVLTNAYQLTYLIGINNGIKYISEPDYRKVHFAFAVNIVMIFVAAAIFIYGIVFAVKNKSKSSIRFKILKRVLLVFLLMSIAAVVYAGLGEYSENIGVHDDTFGEKEFPAAQASIAMTTAKIKFLSTDENSDKFIITTKMICKESKYLIVDDSIWIQVYYDDNINEIGSAGTMQRKNIIWQEKGEEKFPNSFVSGSTCYWDKNNSFFVKKNGSFTLRDYLTINDWWINILPFMKLYTDCDYLLEWRTEDIEYTFELLPEYFIYAKEFGSYTHIEKYADLDYETNYVPVAVPSGAKRKMVKGSSVCIKYGADDYNGTKLFDYVYDRQYRISQIDGDRAVIVYDGETVAAMNTADLYFATEIQ